MLSVRESFVIYWKSLINLLLGRRGIIENSIQLKVSLEIVFSTPFAVFNSFMSALKKIVENDRRDLQTDMFTHVSTVKEHF